MEDQLTREASVPPVPETAASAEVRTFPCEQCGADLELKIGQVDLHCPYCGFQKTIGFTDGAKVEEQDLEATLRSLAERRTKGASGALASKSEVHCGACGATVVFDGTLTSTSCDYCGSPIQRSDVHEAKERIPVDGVLPFAVEREAARTGLRAWVKSRWFAPNDFKQRGVQGHFAGIYLPYWTFDAMTSNAYEGERGDHYTVTVGTGDNKRTETRTRWTRVRGAFSRFFDDVLICAARSVSRKLIDALEPWPLKNAVPFTGELLAGYRAMTYDIELPEGFKLGRERMHEALEQETRRHIGGDEQRILTLQTQWAALTYKHVLLPVWMLAYRYRDKSYQVVVNATTGEVQGERPYSAWKIAFAVLVGALVAGGIFYFTQGQ